MQTKYLVTECWWTQDQNYAPFRVFCTVKLTPTKARKLLDRIQQVRDQKLKELVVKDQSPIWSTDAFMEGIEFVGPGKFKEVATVENQEFFEHIYDSPCQVLKPEVVATKKGVYWRGLLMDRDECETVTAEFLEIDYLTKMAKV